MQMTSNEMMLGLGIAEDVRNPDDSILEQVSIVLTLSSAKLLMSLLTKAIEHFEADNKTVIPIDNERLTAIAKAFGGH